MSRIPQVDAIHLFKERNYEPPQKQQRPPPWQLGGEMGSPSPSLLARPSQYPILAPKRGTKGCDISGVTMISMGSKGNQISDPRDIHFLLKGSSCVSACPPLRTSIKTYVGFSPALSPSPISRSVPWRKRGLPSSLRLARLPLSHPAFVSSPIRSGLPCAAPHSGRLGLLPG